MIDITKPAQQRSGLLPRLIALDLCILWAQEEGL